MFAAGLEVPKNYNIDLFLTKRIESSIGAPTTAGHGPRDLGGLGTRKLWDAWRVKGEESLFCLQKDQENTEDLDEEIEHHTTTFFPARTAAMSTIKPQS